jgi:hypothetical protein
MIGQNQDRAQRARLLLMSQMLDEPCFNTLRTQEQLGYIVGSGMMVMNTVQGFRILIQSEKDCAFLEKRIDNFLVNFEKELEEMSEGDFQKHKIGLINKRLEKLKNLGEESGRLWHHVSSEAFDFDLGKFNLMIITHLRIANKSSQSTATSNTSSPSQKPISKDSSAPTSTPPPKPAPKPPSTSSPKAKPSPPTTTSRNSPPPSRKPSPSSAAPKSTKKPSPPASQSSTSAPVPTRKVSWAL